MADPANPKDGIGAKKAGISVLSGKVILALGEAFGGVGKIPMQPLFEMALAFCEGALKYGRHNYRASGVRACIYYDAFNRHMTQWFTKESDIDRDSGLHHASKAVACLAILMDSRDMGNWVDDRPPRLPMQVLPPMDLAKCHTATGYYEQAMYRAVAWWEGGHDENLIQAMQLLLKLRQEVIAGTLQDDREEQPFCLDEMNKATADIIARYPSPLPAYTQRDHGIYHLTRAMEEKS